VEVLTFNLAATPSNGGGATMVDDVVGSRWCCQRQATFLLQGAGKAVDGEPCCKRQQCRLATRGCGGCYKRRRRLAIRGGGNGVGLLQEAAAACYIRGGCCYKPKFLICFDLVDLHHMIKFSATIVWLICMNRRIFLCYDYEFKLSATIVWLICINGRDFLL
jgi:hypothetical protein